MKYREVCKYNMEMMKNTKHHKAAIAISVIAILVYVVYVIHTYITSTKACNMLFDAKGEEQEDDDIRLDLVFNKKEVE